MLLVSGTLNGLCRVSLLLLLMSTHNVIKKKCLEKMDVIFLQSHCFLLTDVSLHTVPGLCDLAALSVSETTTLPEETSASPVENILLITVQIHHQSLAVFTLCLMCVKHGSITNIYWAVETTSLRLLLASGAAVAQRLI